MKITLPDLEPFEEPYEGPVSAQKLAEKYQGRCPHRLLLCVLGGQNMSLSTMIEKDQDVAFLDLRAPAASRAYQGTLQFLYIKAVHDVLGPAVQVHICNALNKGVYTTIKAPLDAGVVKKIEDRMRQMAAQKLPFRETLVGRKDLQVYAREKGRESFRRLLDSAPDLDDARIASIDGETDVFFHPLLPDAGYLYSFEVRRYRNGVLVRFPQPADPDRLAPYVDETYLYEAFSEASRWDRIAQVYFASDLNELMSAGKALDLVLLNEALHEKRIAQIAEMIRDQGKRLVLIAGPSSSGKTTFANRLIIQLRVLGMHPLYLGTDDYFLDREETPTLPSGEKDYDSLRALDLPLFTRHMNDLLAGRKVDLPRFDFKTGKKVFRERIASLEPGQPIVLEGIHGLNPALTEGISDEAKFRIYISPLTQLNIDEHNRISTTDTRLLRRTIRDFIYRGYSASETIRKWPAVREGEEKFIFPFNDEADVFFNSHCLYELAVLKKYAEPLLKEIPLEDPQYPEARRLLEFLEFFVAMPDDKIIPNNSILREFIGGSVLVH